MIFLSFPAAIVIIFFLIRSGSSAPCRIEFQEGGNEAEVSVFDFIKLEQGAILFFRSGCF